MYSWCDTVTICHTSAFVWAKKGEEMVLLSLRYRDPAGVKESNMPSYQDLRANKYMGQFINFFLEIFMFPYCYNLTSVQISFHTEN